MRIFGEFDPDDMTRLLDITPTSFHRKGEKDILGRPFKNDGWFLETDLPDTASVEQQFLRLNELLKGKSEIINSLVKKFTLDVFCGITSQEQGGFGLSTDALRIFSEFRIGLEVSLILLNPDE